VPLCVEQLEERAVPSAAPNDILYIGDAGDNSVKAFDAQTGAFLGDEVAPGAGGLNGPRGLIFRNPGELLVVNQNVNTDVSGEILRFNARTGASLDAVVPSADPDAPFAPRGMVLRGNVLYVADLQGATTADGRVAEYNVNNGEFLGELKPTGLSGQFNPRGVVFGPDGSLYVSSFDTTNPLVGYVFRFDTTTGALQIVAANNGDGVADPGEIADLHRPEGLVFGPDGTLYVTSFRANASDTDKILELNASTGALKDEILLDQAGQPRAFAQAILFGPDGHLFVPISGNGPDTGAVRSYDVTTKTFTNFIQPNADGGPLIVPFYLTFGQTNPATLAYNTKPGAETSAGTPAGTAASASAGHSASHADGATNPALSGEDVDVLFALLSDPASGDGLPGHRDNTHGW
jgi:DNA-binding beta-propeller fold protein YncE